MRHILRQTIQPTIEWYAATGPKIGQGKFTCTHRVGCHYIHLCSHTALCRSIFLELNCSASCRVFMGEPTSAGQIRLQPWPRGKAGLLKRILNSPLSASICGAFASLAAYEYLRFTNVVMLSWWRGKMPISPHQPSPPAKDPRRNRGSTSNPDTLKRFSLS